MSRSRASLRAFWRSSDGAAAVEAAFIVPLLVTLALGSFDVSAVIARRSELLGAMSEASSVALASEPTSASRRETLSQIIQASTDLTAEQVEITAAYRCGSDEEYLTSPATCGADRVSLYVKIVLSDTYTPLWNDFGVGSPIESEVTRHVMIKQQTN
jgi:Flp pilus assembly protein TadG